MKYRDKSESIRPFYKKLFRLRSDFTKSHCVNPDDVIFNLSDRSLTSDEKNLFVRRLNFSLPNKKLNFGDFVIPFEILQRKLKQETIYPNSDIDEDFLKTKLKDIALTGFRSYSPPNSIFSAEELRILNTL